MQQQKTTFRIYGVSLIATLGGFLFGYDTAVISGAISSLQTFFIEPLGLTSTEADTLLGIVVSCALIGCVAGSALGGYVSQVFGRKRGLLLAASLFTISGIGSSIPELGYASLGEAGSKALPLFIIYRIFGGVGIGLASVLSPMYIAEVSPASIRGRLVSWNQLAIVLGILMAYFVNYYISLQGDAIWNLSFGWRWMFVVSTIPAALFFICLWFVPESPRWYALKGRMQKAEEVLCKLNGKEVAAQELTLIKSSITSHSGKLFSFGAAVIIIGAVLSAFQQLVGIQVIMYYTPEIFKNMGYSSDSAMLQTVLVGSVNLIFTIIAIYTIDSFGRKPLLLLGSALMAIFMLVLGGSFYLHNVGTASLISVLGFVAAFAFSWGPVTWVLLSEMFPNLIRSKAISIAASIQWVTNYTVSSTFPLLDRNIWLAEKFNHSIAFFIFGAMALLSLFFVWRFIPETKRCSLEQMESIWGIKK